MFNPNTSIPWQMNRNAIMISDSDDSDDSGQPDPMQVEYIGRQIPQPGMGGYNKYAVDVTSAPDHLGPAMSPYHTTIEQEKKVRSRLREERHAATLPQARRRFLAKLMAPEDPEVAASIRADQFTIQRTPSVRPSSSSPSLTLRPDSQIASKVVSWGIVDVCETDDSGWRRPDPETSGAKGGGPSTVSSPASSSKTKGKITPDRPRAKGRVSSGRSHQRDRRRRWSGAERQDHGTSIYGLPP